MLKISTPPSGFTPQAKRSPGRTHPRLRSDPGIQQLSRRALRQTLTGGFSRVKDLRRSKCGERGEPKSQDSCAAHGNSSPEAEAAADTLEMNNSRNGSFQSGLLPLGRFQGS